MIKSKTMAKQSATKIGGKMTKSKKVKEGRRMLNKNLAKGKNSKNAEVSDIEESDVDVITKNQLSSGRNKIRVVMSDSESEEIERVSKTVKKKVAEQYVPRSMLLRATLTIK